MSEERAPTKRRSNAFSPAEVEAVCRLLEKAATGADIQIILHSESIANVWRKFLSMRDKQRRQVVKVESGVATFSDGSHGFASTRDGADFRPSKEARESYTRLLKGGPL